MVIEVSSADEMIKVGFKIGELLKGGDVIELVGDIGAGKTTLTKGLAKAIGVTDEIQSPTFTISCVYNATDKLKLCHYDFYRLNDAGIMRDELSESISDQQVITVIEWGDIVSEVLNDNTITIKIVPTDIDSRRLYIESSNQQIMKDLEKIS